MAIADFLDMMPDTVTHASLTGRDDQGAPSFGTATSYSARITYKQHYVRNANNEEVLARGIVWVGGTPTVEPEDEITLPDGSTPPIMVAERVSDESGPHHVVVHFG